MELYQYASIAGSSEGDTIRLIDIHPGSTIDILQCTIRHVRLANNPEYEALSYCWGNPSLDQSIKCNGKHLALTASLHGALKQLRYYHSESRTVWADAICINQQDIDERNQQILLMRRIYEQARQVVVWLGEGTNDSWLGMKLIPKLIEAGKKRDSTGDTRDITRLSTSGHLEHTYGLPNRFDDDWRGFFGIVKRPWFGRGWIIQEAALASSMMICFGGSSCSYDDLMRALIFTSDIGFLSEHLSNEDSRVWTTGLTRQALQGGVGQSLISLLLRHRTASTTDPKDRLYAFCGLAADAGPDGLNIRPDYRLPFHEVYRDMAVKMMTKGKSLDVLSVPGDQQNSELPSWVPDLSKPLQTGSLTGLEHNIREHSPYRASLDTICRPEFSRDGHLLGLSGFMIDSVSQVAESQPMEEGDGDAVAPILNLYSAFAERKRYMNWRAVAGLLHSRKYVTGEDLEDAYWQTLIAGYNPGKEKLRNKSQMKAHYVAWTRHSLRHAYLRRLPSPAFECALAFTLTLSICWIILRFFLCLPFVSAPGEFNALMGNLANRRLIRTARGYIGLAGETVQVGDSILICSGGKLPLVARPSEQGHMKLQGDCYIHGIMSGEAFDESKCHLIWFC